jgi:sugar lactone lactonase YvrE
MLLSSSLKRTNLYFGLLFILNSNIYGKELKPIILAGQAGVTGAMDGQGNEAMFNDPHSLAIDKQGNIYVSDLENDNIRKIDPTGYVSTIAGSEGVTGHTNGIGTNATFDGPTGIALDSNGNLFVLEIYGMIREISPSGLVTTFSDVGVMKMEIGPDSKYKLENTSFFMSSGLAIDSNSNVYIADTLHNVIRKITPDGLETNLAGAYNKKGSSDGIGSEAKFNGPNGIAISGDGTIYVTDTGNNLIRKISPDGSVKTIAGKVGKAGSKNGSVSEALFNIPRGIGIDSLNNIYVMDSETNFVRKISSSGRVTTLAKIPWNPDKNARTLNGGGTDLAVDSNGDVYVADSGNSVIRKITQ